MKPPEWLPDWTDPKGYPKQLSLLEWRWQFLRRRLDYQAAWREGERRFKKAWRANPALARALTKKKPKSNVAEWAERQLEAAERLSELAGRDELLRPFAIRDFLNPSKDYPESELGMYFRRPDFGGVVTLDPGDISEAYKRGVVLVAFDLRWNLEQQLRDAKQLLTDERNAAGLSPTVERMHPNRWPLYLRVLDAKASRASLTAIAHGLRLAPAGDSAADLKSRVHEIHDAARRVQANLTS